MPPVVGAVLAVVVVVVVVFGELAEVKANVVGVAAVVLEAAVVGAALLEPNEKGALEPNENAVGLAVLSSGLFAVVGDVVTVAFVGVVVDPNENNAGVVDVVTSGFFSSTFGAAKEGAVLSPNEIPKEVAGVVVDDTKDGIEDEPNVGTVDEPNENSDVLLGVTVSFFSSISLSLGSEMRNDGVESGLTVSSAITSFLSSTFGVVVEPKEKPAVVLETRGGEKDGIAPKPCEVVTSVFGGCVMLSLVSTDEGTSG